METDQIEKVQTISLFAYGTLRKDEPLHGWIESEIIESKGMASLKRHRLFFSSRHYSYPYLIETGLGVDVARGEVYELPLNDQVISMLQMEMNAGYTIGSVYAELDSGEEIEVVACLWQHHDFGGAVPNNDWCSEARREWWR